MTGGSDRLPFNWFPLQGTNASQLGASGGAPVHRPVIKTLWHLSYDQTGQSEGLKRCTPRVHLRVVYASPMDSTSGTSRSFLANTVVFLPTALRCGTHTQFSCSRYCEEYSTVPGGCQYAIMET